MIMSPGKPVIWRVLGDKHVTTASTTDKISYWGNISGAFADGAVLLPLLVALALTTGYSGGMLLASAGLAYVVAGFIFKIPMPVQPLKSVVVAALAVGATMGEIRLSGLAIGLVCLALAFMPANKWAAKVPRSLVHGLQFGLGILLIFKGLDWDYTSLAVTSDISVMVVISAALLLVIISEMTSLPLMGWLASTALIVAAVMAYMGDAPAVPAVMESEAIRFDIILALVLPQLALTMTNSVVATSDVAERYYGEAAKRTNAKALLTSIGVGNILSASVAGLPFCHGSGGLTAHKKGGAVSWHMNLIVGGTLLLLALGHVIIAPVIPAFHPWVVGALLITTGFFHMKLALPSLQNNLWRWQIAVMAIATLLTRNLLIVLLVGIAVYLVLKLTTKSTIVKDA